MKSRLKVVLIDDETKAIKSIQWELEKFSHQVEVLATFTNPIEGLGFLKFHKVDCIFLDIEMPEMDGFEFLSHFKEREFEVVFVTAYDQFALNAIKQSAIDYLLKPIDNEDLETTLNKIKNRLGNKVENDLIEESQHNQSNKRISIPLNGKILFLETDEIIHCESDGNYSKIFLQDKKCLFVTKKLKEIHQLLPSENFFRVHNSYVVNLKKVREYFKTDGYVVLDNLKKIPVSRSKRTSFLDKI